MQVGCQGLGGVANPRESSRNKFGIYIRVQMQVGWQGLGIYIGALKM